MTDPFLQIKLKVGLLKHAIIARCMYMYFLLVIQPIRLCFHKYFCLCTVSTKGNHMFYADLLVFKTYFE